MSNMEKFICHLICNRVSYYLIILCFAIISLEISVNKEEEKPNVILIIVCIAIILLNLFKVIGIQIFNVCELRTQLFQEKILSELKSINETLSNALTNIEDEENLSFIKDFYSHFCGLKNTIKEIREKTGRIVGSNQETIENHNIKKRRKKKSKRRRKNRSFY